MNRRQFLGAGSLALTSACSMRHAGIRPPGALSNPARRWARVDVSTDRVIRTVVGLRPFRPSGFVVRAESMDGKTIVHNYGHGGAGVTLSWGTSKMAADLVNPTGITRAAVLGAGAVGLATARLLQERGLQVTIYTKALPPETTSNIAGAQIYPALAYDHDAIAPGFRARLLEAMKYSYKRYQLMVGDYYGVRWMPNYSMGNQPFSDTGMTSRNGLLGSVLPEVRDLTRQEHPFPYPYVRQFDTMFVMPSAYLESMMREFRIAGGSIVVREMHDLREVMTLPEPVVMNCTGLGAKALFNDAELTPVKGQLTILLPQPEVDYATLPDGFYMFPRRDGILLGGTHEEGNWDLEPDREAEKRIIAAHARVFSW